MTALGVWEDVEGTVWVVCRLWSWKPVGRHVEPGSRGTWGRLPDGGTGSPGRHRGATKRHTSQPMATASPNVDPDQPPPSLLRRRSVPSSTFDSSLPLYGYCTCQTAGSRCTGMSIGSQEPPTCLSATLNPMLIMTYKLCAQYISWYSN